MTTNAIWDELPDSPASIYSCSTYYSSNSPSTLPSPWSEIDRSLKTFNTRFDMTCFDEMEDQLIESPLESFSALCYQSAVARQTPEDRDPDWCVFIKTSNRMNWQDDEDTLDHMSPVDSQGSLVCQLFRSRRIRTNGRNRDLPTCPQNLQSPTVRFFKNSPCACPNGSPPSTWPSNSCFATQW